MKPFKKFVLLSITPLFFTGVISYLIAESFIDFLPKTIFFTVGFLVITSLIYVYVFEKLQSRKNLFFENIAISISSILISIFAFGIMWQAIFLEDFTILTPIYQGLLSVFILALEIAMVTIYRNKNSKDSLYFKEKPQIYIAIVLSVSFIHTLFMSSFYLEEYNLMEFKNSIENYFIKALLFTSILMLFLFIFSKLKFTKNNIYLNIILTSIIAYFLIYELSDTKFQLNMAIIRLFAIGFTNTIFCATIINYRNKNEKLINLTNSISKKNAQFMQLKNQINPHFLFNNLNTLISFIEIEPKKAIEFGHNLSNVYRHYLKTETEDFVSLSKELDFITEYLEIYKAKFESGFTFKIEKNTPENLHILSISLQEIIENIFKHNILDDKQPIEIKIYTENDFLVISNSLNVQNEVISTKKGLKNIGERTKILLNKEIFISENETLFKVMVPIIKLKN